MEAITSFCTDFRGSHCWPFFKKRASDAVTIVGDDKCVDAVCDQKYSAKIPWLFQCHNQSKVGAGRQRSGRDHLKKNHVCCWYSYYL